METFAVGDRVIFREDESTEDTKGTVTAIREDLDLPEAVYSVELDDERDGYTNWTVAHHELTKTGYVSLDTLMEGE